MAETPEQHDNRWSAAKPVAAMSDDEVRHEFDALIAKLNKEERSKFGKW